jgi:hypothetical protein
MSVTDPEPAPGPESTPDSGLSHADRFAAEIARVRASGALGAGGRLMELFDFLVKRSAEGAAPKEAEIALEVFGKADTDATRDDPVARVYIHRLRKRLDDFYLRNGAPSGVRLDIPRGEYRILAVDPSAGTAALAKTPAPAAGPAPSPVPAEAPPKARRPFRWAWAAAGFAGLLVAVNVAAWAMFSRPAAMQAPADIRQAPLWSGLTRSTRPLVVVVGDYYIFGEYQDRVFLHRLIRDFSINSREDLLARYMNDPRASDQYGDVALQYLPTSAAYALADLAPLIQGRRVEVELASQMQPDKLRDADVIYIGLFSGMGPLRVPAFARSRFQIGESYDQIIDRHDGVTYTSEAFLAAPSDTMYRDYGLVSAFHGPTGNRIIVLAGARDTALMGVAEALTRGPSLDALKRAVGAGEDFEAMFEVKGQKHVNLESRILGAGALDSASIWRGERRDPLEFPTE